MNKVKQVISLLDSGKRPIIKYLKPESEFHDMDQGQLFEVKGYTLEHNSKDPKEVVWVFHLSFEDYVEYNQSIAKPNYYDKDGKACLKWHETGRYPVNYRMDFYVDITSEDQFEILEDTPILVKMFGESSEKNYLRFLEQELLKRV